MTVATWGDALAWFLLGLCSGWVVVGALGFVGFVLLFSWEDPDAGKG